MHTAQTNDDIPGTTCQDLVLWLSVESLQAIESRTLSHLPLQAHLETSDYNLVPVQFFYRRKIRCQMQMNIWPFGHCIFHGTLQIAITCSIPMSFEPCTLSLPAKLSSVISGTPGRLSCRVCSAESRTLYHGEPSKLTAFWKTIQESACWRLRISWQECPMLNHPLHFWKSNLKFNKF